MNLKGSSAYWLSVLVCMSIFAASAASAQCIPVVYAFRHAEDFDQKVEPYPCLPGSRVNCTTKLTPVGMEHADLYVEMIANLENKEHFCPLAAAYAVNPINPDGAGGTTNPYYTGKPLANTLFDLNPYIEVDGKRIDQKLKEINVQSLYTALIQIAKADQSVALFWTSEGLHDLGAFLGSDIIPKKTPSVSPPRNAAYIFRYDGNNGYTPPAEPDEFVQCFNYAVGGKAKNNFINRFYCGYASNANLQVPESDFDQLHGRICSPYASDFIKKAPVNYYGYCESPPTGAAP